MSKRVPEHKLADAIANGPKAKRCDIMGNDKHREIAERLAEQAYKAGDKGYVSRHLRDK